MGNFHRGYATRLHGKALQGCIALCAAWAFTLFGYDQGVLGGLIALPNFLESNNMNPDDANLAGTVVAIYSVGCFTGCIIMAFIGKMLGRRMFIVIGGALIILGGSLQAGSQDVSYLIGGRVVAGIGMGKPTRFSKLSY
jgi:MFS family permease